MPKSDIFRQDLLDKLSSPEELDQLMKVTSPRGWLILFTIGLIMLTAVLWSIFGTIPTVVSGQGMLIRTGGVYPIVANGSGQILEVNVVSGEIVEPGQVVARIKQEELTNQIDALRNKIFALEKDLKETREFVATSKTLRDTLHANKKAAIKDSIQTKQRQQEHLKDKIESQERLLESGLITEKKIFQTRFEYESLKNEILEARNQLESLTLEKKQTENQYREKIASLILDLNSQKRRLDNLLYQRTKKGEIVSSYYGKIIDTLHSQGSFVNKGAPILRMERMGRNIQDIEVLFYVNPRDGKKIRGGMTARISPSTVKKEEFGVVLGMVTNVSNFPATKEGMMDMLSNQDLVRNLSKKGAPFEVSANLTPSRDSYSGYVWTSREGPEITLTSGIICDVEVVVKENPPITLVIPSIKKWLGL